ncbi:MAG TPA: MFS transporter, partial [Casimicrobiaceae bacterium]|nr:MFS transporter [Casimicrobiaceae bacterium]
MGPRPKVSAQVSDDAGPVMVTIEYHVAPANREAFLAALEHQAAERRRDGAYWWGVFEDVAHSGHFVETFHVESWLEHKRQHARVTHADRDVERRV